MSETVGKPSPEEAARAGTARPSGSPGTSARERPRDRDGSFVVRGTDEPGGMVRLYEDGTCVGADEADATTGEWSLGLVNVSEGTRTYEARATDASGNVSEDSDGVTVVVDKTALTVSATTPTGKTVPRTALITATFFEGMNERSVEASGAIKLAMKGNKGTTTPVAATVSYDPNTMTVTLDSSVDLKGKATYTATITAGARDKAGSALAHDKTRTFKVAKQ